jgi:hypothetical protein
MSRLLLLRIAASLSLFTAFGHTAGIFMPVPPEHTEVLALLDAMKRTMVTLPMGTLRSAEALLDGANFCASVVLALCAAVLFAVATAKNEPVIDRVILLNGVALLSLSVISAIYFFPAPTICTGLAGVLAIWAATRAAGAGKA